MPFFGLSPRARISLLWPLVSIAACTSASPPMDPLRDAAAVLDATVSAPELPVWPASRTATYAASEGALPNPERGLYARVDIMKDGAGGLAAATTTLLHSYIRLDAFRDSPLPNDWLESLAFGLSAVRDAGKKVILRFAYNHGPWPKCDPDAGVERMLEHIRQVAPVLSAHAAVIAWFEAGFIGCWGEWHTSTNGLESNVTAKVNVVAAMLMHWPDKAVQLRYPADLRQLRQLLPPTLRRMGHPGADGPAIARLGFHHDCVFASVPDDYGTWGRRGGGVQADKDFVAQTAETAPTGGETCAVSPRAKCAIALAEFEAQRWTDLNKDFNRDVLDLLEAEGCMQTIADKLGYRFALIDAAHDEVATPSGTLRAAFRVRNEGWAPLYTQRPVQLVLDGPVRVAVALNEDVRQWRPGRIQVVNAALPLPAHLPEGHYRLAVALPDPDATLAPLGAYAIRFANKDVWDDATAVNTLGWVRVGDPPDAAAKDAAGHSDAAPSASDAAED